VITGIPCQDDYLQRSSTANLHQHIAGTLMAMGVESDARIINLGCGSGALLNRLAGMGYQSLTGVDIDPPGPNQDIAYLQADLDHVSLNLDDSSFDLALAIEVIEHIEDLGIL
jgi:2-polyprenyl-3-methyl-5-hydroxy-6-metoxy-1,4-benzoquinol methylase